MTNQANTKVPRRPDRLKWLILICIGLFAIIGSAILLGRDKHMQSLYVPNRDLPAYYLVKDTDVVSTTVSLSKLRPDMLTSKNEIVGHYSLDELEANVVISKLRMMPTRDSELVNNTIALPIPSTGAMAFGGHLPAGAVVSVWRVYSTDDPPTWSPELVLPKALVLDVLEVEDRVDSGRHPYILILAVPVSRQSDIIAAVNMDSLVITLDQ